MFQLTFFISISIFLFSLIFILQYHEIQGNIEKIPTIFHDICYEGNLYEGYEQLLPYSEDASALYGRAALEVILYSNITQAVALHKKAKGIDTSTIPPLANFHLQGISCGGLSDLYYVSAIILKQMVDGNIPIPAWIDAMTTLITLTSDSGLYQAAERHLLHALELTDPTNEINQLESIQSKHLIFLFRSMLMTPGVYESYDHVVQTRQLLLSRVHFVKQYLQSHYPQPILPSLDEFILSPTFYYIYQGYNDCNILTNIHELYRQAYPALWDRQVLSSSSSFNARNTHKQTLDSDNNLLSNQSNMINQSNKKIKIGFVSSYFRRHSICKLFCHIILQLSLSIFDVTIFSALSETKQDTWTQKLIKHSKEHSDSFHYVTIGQTYLQNRQEVLQRQIDILVYLDIGMEPATTIWAAGRLAPYQVCIWGHPTTTGLGNMDYYLTSQKFHQNFGQYELLHQHNEIHSDLLNNSETNLLLPPYSLETKPFHDAQDYFLEQLIQFDTLGYSFPLPSLLKHKHFPIQSDIILRNINYYQQLQLILQYWKTKALKKKDSKGITKGLIALQELVAIKQQHLTSKPFILCPQHLPKFHVSFDSILLPILSKYPNAIIILIDNTSKFQWKRTLLQRWQTSFLQNPLVNTTRTMSSSKIFSEQIIWMPSLSPEEYQLLLTLGDVMLDPFPFGGGVTSLEAFAFGTPVITLPKHQNVPQLTSGMIQQMNGSALLTDTLIVHSIEGYLQSIDQLLDVKANSDLHDENDLKGSIPLIQQIRQEILLHHEKIYQSSEVIVEWENFLQNIFVQ